MPQQHWGLDLGTTNTVLAVCEEERVRVVDLAGLSAHTPLIPSAVELLDARGRRAFAGQEAVARNWASPSRALARSFKRPLRFGGDQPVAQVGQARIAAQLAAQVFLREVLRALRRQYHPGGLMGWLQARLGLWPTTLTIPVPVDSYETYSREVRCLAHRCGVKRVSSLDEPVAAALGYGLDVRRTLTLLVVDFGGGTLDLAVVRLGGPEADRGRSEVLATVARDLGGDIVDEWLMEEWCQRSGAALEMVRHDLKWRAEALKQRLSRPSAPPDELEGVPFTREEFIALLEQRGLYCKLSRGVQQVLDEAAHPPSHITHRVSRDFEELDEVLLIGGSTLLPQVPECLEEALGLRVRRWRPFEAVARGAALFGAGREVEPILYHDYALRVFRPDLTAQERRTLPEWQQYEYERLIPAGTRYPTPPGAEVVRYYEPAYEGQEAISLPICELGRFGWEPLRWKRRRGQQYYWQPAGEEERERVVCLNEADQDIPLQPPGRKGKTRLRVTYWVDEDRWLRMTVHDLQRKADLLTNRAVVELR